MGIAKMAVKHLFARRMAIRRLRVWVAGSRPALLGTAGGLLLLMAATRGFHVGSEFNLGDASLAVFFLGGLYLTGGAWFALFIAVAAAVDAAAIAGGVSAWCVTPAYPFLLAAYGGLWLAGYWCKPGLVRSAFAQRIAFHARNSDRPPAYDAARASARGGSEFFRALAAAARVYTSLLAGTLVAFLISNASFYAFSGYFGTLAPGQYAASVLHYFWPYAGYTLLYATICLLLDAGWRALTGARSGIGTVRGS